VSVSPPTDGGGAVTEERPDAAQQLCPRCGTAYAAGQEYCLECGLRLPAEPRGVVPRLGHAWRRRVAWYPGDWIWPSLLALVIAALAGLGAAWVSHDDNATAYKNETSPTSAVTSTIAPPETTTAGTATAPTSTAKRPPPPPPPPAAPKAWPAGQSGYTVVLQSLPSTNGRAFALAQARAALHAGVPDVGILDSSQFSSLHPGYYVLFSGVFHSFDDANAGVTAARSHGYPRAYPRQITP
jgi:cell division septation protein DedD